MGGFDRGGVGYREGEFAAAAAIGGGLHIVPRPQSEHYPGGQREQNEVGRGFDRGMAEELGIEGRARGRTT